MNRNGVGLIFVDGYPAKAELDSRGVAQGVLSSLPEKVELIHDMIHELHVVAAKGAKEPHHVALAEHLETATNELKKAMEESKK